MPPLDLVIHSGGQTGVDRAALDAALASGVPVGGWCPRGRRAEDGRIHIRYPLRETPSNDVAERTAWNVRDADATLALMRGAPDSGTALTIRLAEAGPQPCLVVDLAAGLEPEEVAAWLHTHAVRVLNVAGPRESNAPGIYADARAFVTNVLSTLGY